MGADLSGFLVVPIRCVEFGFENMTKEEFVEKAMAAAHASSAVSGLSPEVTVAQAALESRHGQSLLSREAHNYFGIKARNGQPSIEMRTWEMVHGKRVEIRARFARFGSMQECFESRDRMILTLPCYAEARASAADPERFVRALAKRWATDPDYAEKLLRLVQTCRDVGCGVSVPRLA